MTTPLVIRHPLYSQHHSIPRVSYYTSAVHCIYTVYCIHCTGYIEISYIGSLTVPDWLIHMQQRLAMQETQKGATTFTTQKKVRFVTWLWGRNNINANVTFPTMHHFASVFNSMCQLWRQRISPHHNFDFYTERHRLTHLSRCVLRSSTDSVSVRCWEH